MNNFEDIIQNKLANLASELADALREEMIKTVSVLVARPRSMSIARRRVAQSLPGPASVTLYRRRTARPSPSRSARRSAEQIQAMSAKILAYVAKHPGETSEVIKKRLGVSPAEWMLPIALLAKQKKIRTTGRLRSTKYFPRGKK